MKLAISVLRPWVGPWGDYSHTLIHGSVEFDAQGNVQRVVRIGGFCPSLFSPFPGVLLQKEHSVVDFDDAARIGVRLVRVESSIIKAAIREADFQRENPPFYPKGGEPEGYLEGKKSTRAATTVGPLQQIVVKNFSVDVSTGQRHFKRATSTENVYVTSLDADLFTLDVPMFVRGIPGVLVTDEFLGLLKARRALSWMRIVPATFVFE